MEEEKDFAERFPGPLLETEEGLLEMAVAGTEEEDG
jgi:hypothetical protein